MVFYVVFNNDGGPSMRGTIRVLRIIYGVIGNADRTFRSEVNFRDQHYVYFLNVIIF